MGVQLLCPKRRRDQKSKRGKCGPVISAIMGTYLAVGLSTVLFFFALCVMLLTISPDLVQRLLQIKCEEFNPEYLSPNPSAADNVEYSDHQHMNYSPLPPAGPNGSQDNTTTTWATPSKREASNGTLEDVETPLPEKKVRVLLAIFMEAYNLSKRHLLRMAYGSQSSKDIDVTIRFIIGSLEGRQASHKDAVARDNTTFGDIIVLDCPENVNEGKSFAFFSSLPGILMAGGLQKPYDYVMKADDDAYIRIANLGTHLKPLPRTDLYYGYSLPCGNGDPYTGYMAGAGYLLSWDLVEWIAESPIPRNKTVGWEDILVRDWFEEGGVAKNRATNLGLFYDLAQFSNDTRCAHELKLDAILIHKLKTIDQWHEVLAFFLTDKSNSLH